MYFHERVSHAQQLCRPCAAGRGVSRIADRSIDASLARRSSRLPAWWRWTVYLDHALQWG